MTAPNSRLGRACRALPNTAININTATGTKNLLTRAMHCTSFRMRDSQYKAAHTAGDRLPQDPHKKIASASATYKYHTKPHGTLFGEHVMKIILLIVSRIRRKNDGIIVVCVTREKGAQITASAMKHTTARADATSRCFVGRRTNKKHHA